MNLARRLRVGISTCPNDTFAFHGLLTHESDPGGIDWEFELLDVQTLNERWLAGDFDLAKASFAAALRAGPESLVLPAGSAIGRGVGPVVLAPALPHAPHSPERVLAPGEHTTATLLWRLFHPGQGTLRQVVFSEILPALARRDADLGVCIHEGRFTYAAHGLRLVEDLGATWEHTTGAPLPLGGILARRRLGPTVTAQATLALQASLDRARAAPQAAAATMRRWAQEHSDEVLWKHVELYVTGDTRELGPEARRSLLELAHRAHAAGLAPAGALALSDEPASWR